MFTFALRQIRGTGTCEMRSPCPCEGHFVQLESAPRVSSNRLPAGIWPPALAPPRNRAQRGKRCRPVVFEGPRPACGNCPNNFEHSARNSAAG